MKPVSIAQATGNDRAWLTLSDQSVVLVYGPKIYGTKVVGFVKGKYEEYPTAGVKEVHVRQAAGGRTAALVAVGVLAVGGLVTWSLSSLGTKGAHTPDICDIEPDNELCG